MPGGLFRVSGSGFWDLGTILGSVGILAMRKVYDSSSFPWSFYWVAVKELKFHSQNMGM